MNANREVWTYYGKPITEMTREELIATLNNVAERREDDLRRMEKGNEMTTAYRGKVTSNWARRHAIRSLFIKGRVNGDVVSQETKGWLSSTFYFTDATAQFMIELELLCLPNIPPLLLQQQVGMIHQKYRSIGLCDYQYGGLP